MDKRLQGAIMALVVLVLMGSGGSSTKCKNGRYQGLLNTNVRGNPQVIIVDTRTGEFTDHETKRDALRRIRGKKN